MSIVLSSVLPIRPQVPGPSDAPLSMISALDPAISAARESLSQRAYLRIRSSLIHSELPPGQRLVLRPLAAELRLSPTPVREALLRLVSEQALALDERGSAIVPVIGVEEFREIIDIRCDLEGRAAARAAVRASPAEIEQIAAFVQASNRIEGPAPLSRDAELHRAICRAARSPLILRILEGIWMRVGPVYALEFRHAAPAQGRRHERLLEALRAGDAEGAREAVIADLRASSGWLECALIEAA